MLLAAIDVRETEEEMGRQAARAAFAALKEAIDARGVAVALFASAPSQHATWRALIDLWRAMPEAQQTAMGNAIIAFHMDEYLGLPEGAPQSFGKVLGERLYPQLRIPAENIHFINSGVAREEAQTIGRALQAGADPQSFAAPLAEMERQAKAEAARVCALFEAHGGRFDLVLGGIGKIPHVAFNDPPARFDEPETVRVVRLNEESRIQQVADGEFENVEDVPTHAMTFSLRPIFEAGRIVIVVPRALKANSVRDTLEGPITEMAPASGLRLPEVLPKVLFFLDRAAAAKSPLALEAFARTGAA
jgi:glucosamine-6-phosphate deaminase